MGFILVLAVTAILAWLFRRLIKKYPVVFYILALLLNVLYVVSVYGTLPEVIRRTLFLLMQKSTLSLALFAVVMFIGAFRRDSVIGVGLRPVRAELSIAACILTMGHMFVYLMAFLPRALGGGLTEGRFLLFFTTCVLLLVLLLILGITSFSEIKRRMNAASWVKLQKWAYVFFGLIYVHLVSILLPSALQQGVTARISIAIYTVLFGLYAIMRVRRALIDREAPSA